MEKGIATDVDGHKWLKGLHDLSNPDPLEKTTGRPPVIFDEPGGMCLAKALEVMLTHKAGRRPPHRI